ncbi:MAG: hypothetical protein KDD22_07005, partial [Bdellovibrionales bacterium]|nr:hypothetical protein [Bdellovibrionales bacterium]
GKNSVARLDFLSSVYPSLQRSRPGQEFPKVFAELLKLAETPEKRIQLWVSEIKSSRQEHASRDPYGAFKALRKELEQTPVAKRKELMSVMGDEIELETSSLVRSYVDTYSMKTPNNENLTKAEMTNSLISMFKFFDTYFPQSQKRPAMYQLWYDLCGVESRYNCLLEISNNVLKDESLKVFKKRAEVEKIIALNALSQSVDKSYKNDLIKNLSSYVRNSNAPRWAEFANLLGNLLISEGRFGDGIKVLEEILKKQPDEGTFYRVQIARFKAGKFKEVVDAVGPPGAEGSVRLKELNREASLKMAINFDPKKGDFDSYEKNINRFLLLNEDKEKEAIVLAEYLKALTQKGRHLEAIEKLGAATQEIRGDRNIIPILEDLMQYSLVRSKFDWIRKILPDPRQPATPKVDYLSVISRLVSEKIFDRPRFAKLGRDQKSFLFQNLALVSPDIVVDYLVQFSEQESSDLRQVGVLAYQIKENNLSPVMTQAMHRALGDQLPSSWLSAPITPSEKVAMALAKEKIKGSSKKIANLLKSQMDRLRKTRSLAQQDLAGKDVQTRLRILETLQSAELRVAENIMLSPMPKGLSSREQQAYQNGLLKLASEFRDQANQYSLVIRHDKGQAIAEEKSLKRLPASVSAKRFPLPQSKETSYVVKIAKEQGVLAGLIYLDVLRDSQKISDKEYFQTKAGLLLRLPSNIGRYTYVKDMLKQAKMMDLLNILEKG